MTALSLPPHLSVERELCKDRSWLVRDLTSGEACLLKRSSAAAAILRSRWRELLQRGEGILEVETQLLVRDGFVLTLRPWVAGKSLRELRPTRNAIELVLRVSEELSALHARDLVHGNLHAGNVLVAESGKLRLVDGLEPAQPRAEGVFAAPEQLRGEPPTPQTDVHALGGLAFELLAGRPAFPGPAALESIRRVLYEEADVEGASLPPGTAPILRRAMSKNPLQRYRRMEDLRNALHALVPSAAIERRRLPRRGLRARAAAARRSFTADRLRWPSPRLALGLGAVAAAGLVALAIRPLSSARVLEREVEALLVERNLAQARRLVAARRHAVPAPTADKLAGDIDCAQGASLDCLHRYRSALGASSRYAGDERLRRNVLELLPREDRTGLVAAVLAKLDGVKGDLVEATRSQAYWKRWNAVRALEQSGDRRAIDYTQVYSLDLLHASSCPTRRAALARLLELHDRAALPALERVGQLNDSCLRDELPRAIAALR